MSIDLNQINEGNANTTDAKASKKAILKNISVAKRNQVMTSLGQSNTYESENIRKDVVE